MTEWGSYVETRLPLKKFITSAIFRVMATAHPRLMVVLEPMLYRWVKTCSKKEGLSLSAKLRDLIREAYESYEDRFWAKEAEKRMARFDRKKFLTHEEFWKKAGL